ncbi:expressed protein [Phakopsora pachyrhizi]|uniref:Expressed protein n=1 Tax=Phakopsora pachyrhizi TaxID=170000 RepID=A0AAV0B254_PHAPC|nr:expressed protein [Phakopsora pachyrhizi]
MTNYSDSSREIFQLAAKFISSLPKNHVDVPERLRLYALFKIVTTSNSPPGRASLAFWDFEAKAKSDSWRSVRAELLSLGCDDLIQLASNEYIDRAKKLGWEVPSLGDTSDANPINKIDDRVREQLSKIMMDDDEMFNKSLLTNCRMNEKVDEDDKNDEFIQRDEYGFQIQRDIDIISDLPTAEQKETGINFGMASVSKLINSPITKPAGGLYSDSKTQDSSQLHELILDKNESEAIEHLKNALQQKGETRLRDTINIYHEGYTPLHLASDQGLTTLVKKLLELGADPTLRDQIDKLTAFELAKEAEMLEIQELLRNTT